uniref:Prolamin n=1 Tax=Avena sativa TaxID=4498 RepID=Q09072_AVESA|nr:avenin [Avena sativa]
MKTFLIIALLAMAVATATATTTVQYNPSEQYQPYPEQQEPFVQQQQPFVQQQQPFVQQQQMFLQPLLQQQLNPCKQFLVQQCSPVAAVPFLRSQILRQAICQVTRQQCCRQLAQIPEQLRCPAIHSVVQSIILQQQQQQQQFIQPQLQQQVFQPQLQLQQQVFQPQLQQQVFQPQLQQVFNQPQMQGQIEGMRAFALQALPAMCDVYVPPQCPVATAPLGGF